MRITIAERLRPYSHTPGVDCILPGSSLGLQIYPCLIRVYDLSQSHHELLTEFHLDLKGPLKDFTVLNDLEKGEVKVWGHTLKGFVRYRLVSQEEGISLALCVEKTPEGGMPISLKKGLFCWHSSEQAPSSVSTAILQPKESLTWRSSIGLLDPYHPPLTDRLSLGSHKAQDWDLVKRRLDLKEILPVWNRLGQLIRQPLHSKKREGTATLLEDCERAIQGGHPELIASPLLNLFQAGFRGLLVPRLQDDQYQGIVSHQTTDEELSPLILLTEGRVLIRQLFIQQQGQTLLCLPALPPELHCGRFIQIQVDGGAVDLEWSKKTMRRMIFYPSDNREWTFIFPPAIKSCRLRQREADKGSPYFSGQSSLFEKNSIYFFDNFE